MKKDIVSTVYKWLNTVQGVQIEKGDEIPGEIYRTTTSEVKSREDAEKEAKNSLVVLLGKHPNICFSDISVPVEREGKGTYIHEVKFNNPVLNDASTVLAYGNNKIFENMWRDAHNKAERDPNQLLNNNIDAYRKLVENVLRLSYVSDVTKKISKETSIRPRDINKVLLALLHNTKFDEKKAEEVMPKINWKEQTENAMVIEVTKTPVSYSRIGPYLLPPKVEDCIQIHEPITGHAAFENYMTISDYAEKNKIEFIKETKHERTAKVLNDICTKPVYSGKKKIILFREDDRYGRNALKIAKNMNVKPTVVPIINLDAYGKERIIVRESAPLIDHRFIKGAIIGAGIAGLLTAGIMLGHDDKKKPDVKKPAKIEQTKQQTKKK